MWPFSKKDSFDLNSLEKELNADGPSNGTGQVNHGDNFSEDEEFGAPQTTKEDRLNMAKSVSNTDDAIMPPPSHNTTSYYPQNSYGSSEEYSSHPTSHGGTADLSNNTHKIEVMEKQIEILSSKIDLLKVNLETINSKLSVIDQKIDKKLNSW